MTKQTSREADKFVIRLPEGLRDRICQVAASNHRSMNAEMVDRLLKSLDNQALVEEDVTSSTDRPTTWTPVRGMLVIYKEEQHEIGDFVLGGKKTHGECYLKSMSEPVALTELKPLRLPL